MLVASLALAGCGGADGDGLVVSAASSLPSALTDCTRDHDPPVRLQFSGSDELAAQIRQGVEPDVYAAANTKLPDALWAEGLLERPVVFATNTLVLAVGEGSTVGDLEDLEAPGTRVAVGSGGVPVGDYTRAVLSRLDTESEEAILANVRSEEPDVKGIVGKLSQGAADAGFVYVTDAQAAGLAAIDLPAGLRPEVAYGAGVVEGSENGDEAAAFVEGLTDGECATALREAGFGGPPA